MVKLRTIYSFVNELQLVLLAIIAWAKARGYVTRPNAVSLPGAERTAKRLLGIIFSCVSFNV